MYFRVAEMLYPFALCLILNGVFGEVPNNEVAKKTTLTQWYGYSFRDFDIEKSI
jgi:hypothetical protein